MVKAEVEMREKVKTLWRLCFDDSESFIDLYFTMRYSNDINIAIQNNHEVIAALQMVPYTMTYRGREISTAYVSGACTHPNYRNQGAMRKLLSQTFEQMMYHHIVVSTLMPAEPWLFDYYARCGYASIFNTEKTIFTLSTDLHPLKDTSLQITNQYKEEQYEYLDQKLKQLPFAILHTPKDYQTILADLQLSEGKVYSLTQAGATVALAFAHPGEGDSWRIKEIVAQSPTLKESLLQHIILQTKASTLQISSPAISTKQATHPLGMARIIDAKAALSLYAATHPNDEVNITLNDKLLTTNNGYYYLANGECKKSDKQLPGSHLSLTINKLTEKLFDGMHPYMSLMLD